MSHSDGYRTFPMSAQREILKRDNSQCQICGRPGPERGENIDLETHHMRKDPEYIYRNHADSGTMMCIPCYRLITHRTTADDLLFALDDTVAGVNLLYKDIEILMYLYEHDPATTSETCEATSSSA